MAVRILCLHGLGCNAKIFKWQLAPLMQALSSEVEFVFLEGEIECSKPLTTSQAPPPWLCWYDAPAVSEIASAHEQIQCVLDEDGPFDGVVGFSQGASLAASFLLHHALDKPLESPPWTFAIFFAGNLAFSPDHGLYLELLKPLLAEHEARHDDKTFFASLVESTPAYSVLASTSWLQDNDNWKATIAAFEADPRSENSCRPYLEDWTPARIKIPTLHVVGKGDPFREHAKVLYGLCSAERTMYEHTGTHEVPREEPHVDSIAKMMRVLMERSKLFLGML